MLFDSVCLSLISVALLQPNLGRVLAALARSPIRQCLFCRFNHQYVVGMWSVPFARKFMSTNGFLIIMFSLLVATSLSFLLSWSRLAAVFR